MGQKCVFGLKRIEQPITSPRLLTGLIMIGRQLITHMTAAQRAELIGRLWRVCVCVLVCVCVINMRSVHLKAEMLMSLFQFKVEYADETFSTDI